MKNFESLMSDVEGTVKKLENFINTELKPQSTEDNDLVAAALVATGLSWMAHKCHFPIFITIPAMMRMVGHAYGIKVKELTADIPHKDPGPIVLN